MEPQPIQVKASDEDLKGRFSNVTQISHQPEHFVLDFLLIGPPTGQLVSRVIVTPGHLKALLDASSIQLKEYEKNFGKVKADIPKQQFGFTAN